MLRSTSEQPGIHTHPYLLYIRLPEANSRMIEISGEKVRSAYQPCDFTNAIITAGQTVGLIHDVPMVKEIIDRMIKEPERVAQILGKIQRVYFLITARKKGTEEIPDSYYSPNGFFSLASNHFFFWLMRVSSSVGW